MIKNYHAEKTCLLSNISARKILKKIANAGFVDRQQKYVGNKDYDGKDVFNFRIVVYHPDLQEIIDKMTGDNQPWEKKER